jgi:putative nucleotidyltransferase with HDIG domain
MTPRRPPPRLATRTLVVTFATSAIALVPVFAALTMEVRRLVRQGVAERLNAGQQVFAAVERQRDRAYRDTAAALAERPTLKAALDTYRAEARLGHASPALVETLAREVDRLARRIAADVVAVVDERGVTVSSGGEASAAWPAGLRLRVTPERGGRTDQIVRLPDGAFRAVAVPLELDGAPIGHLVLATRVDRAFAERLASAAGAGIVVLDGRTPLASSLPRPLEAVLAGSEMPGSADEGSIVLAGETFAWRRILSLGDVRFLALSSVDAMARPAMSEALRAVAALAGLALLLSALASVWLARALTRPIDTLSGELERMAADRETRARLTVGGTSRELDLLAARFNGLLDALAAAAEETRGAYVSAIRALAAALDARDPYTAGHSERVSDLSVRLGVRLGLRDDELQVLRIGALLHDIGKIGVPDAILQKPGPLTPAEVERIKTHTTLGARILAHVPFLAAHIPIVELHHERPDGRGYPHGLAGEAIPRPARIVHVADAYDAMTTARSYRGARPPAEAVAEICRGAGTEFDAAVAEALAAELAVESAVAAASSAAALPRAGVLSLVKDGTYELAG